MRTTISLERLIEVLDGDRDLVRHLLDEGLLADPREGFSRPEVERVLICRTLVRDLEVDWAGVEIILRLRDELLATQRQLAEIVELLRSHGRPSSGPGGT